VSGWLRVYRLDGTVLKLPEEMAEENATLAEENARLRAMLAQLQKPARA
jgi:regulator of replication initiation timing